MNIWKDISKDTELLFVLIDDVQNISKAKRIFTTLKNVLSDKQIIDETKILFILSSTIDGWEPFIKMNHPIGRFFIPRIELTNFDKAHTIELLHSLLEGTDVTFSNSVKDKIFQYTNGHPFQIHAIGSALSLPWDPLKLEDDKSKESTKNEILKVINLIENNKLAK